MSTILFKLDNFQNIHIMLGLFDILFSLMFETILTLFLLLTTCYIFALSIENMNLVYVDNYINAIFLINYTFKKLMEFFILIE